MNWLGLDIGGANIKAASSDGKVLSMPFQFWVEHDRLAESLVDLIRKFPDHPVAATMTAELADCFESRKQGVHSIVDCLSGVCSELSLPAPIFAGTDVTFRSGDDAKQAWLKTAASNWVMLASYASRHLPQQTGLVIDMGSTTTDIIPVRDGEVIAKGKTDSGRLQNGELVYVGVDRTAVCSVIDALPLNGSQVPIAREFFATVADSMLVAGRSEEDPTNIDTADGQPRTVNNAAQRLCRMVCEDLETIGIDAATKIATAVLQRVEVLVSGSIHRVEAVDRKNIVVTGSGVDFAYEILTRLCPDSKVSRLSSFEGAFIDVVAPAWAVATLAKERHLS